MKKTSDPVQKKSRPESGAEPPLLDYMFFLNRLVAGGEVTLGMLEAALGAERDHFDSWDLDKSGILDLQEWVAMNADVERLRADGLSAAAAAAADEHPHDPPPGGVAERAAARRRFASADRDGDGGVGFDEHVRGLLRREARSVATSFWGYLVDHRRAAPPPA